MTTGKNTVFVNIGVPRCDLRGRSRKDTDREVSQAMCTQSTVTASQLIGKLIHLHRRTGQQFSVAVATDFVAAEAGRCAAHGMFVDPRLHDDTKLSFRVEECLRYCVRSGILRQAFQRHYEIADTLGSVSADWSNPYGAIAYLNNEFDALWLLRTAAAADGQA